MTLTQPDLAREFARGIRDVLVSPECRDKLLARPWSEHKEMAPIICAYLDAFLKAEPEGSALGAPLVDWEGNDPKGRKEPYSYRVLGTSTFPDAAVLRPFRCAFEFDREARTGVSRFKSALMKASVHVLSGAYQASVLVYILKPRPTAYEYLDDTSESTRKLIETLEANGLYLGFASPSSQ